MLGALVSRVISLGLGTLYPAYASYKAVRTKNVKEYVKWMMYWIVFALFTSAEMFADFFLSFWFPFYYELKIMFLLYLLLPATKGSSLLYRKFVHPALLSREQKIDELIEAAQTRSYDTAITLGQRSFRYVTGLIMDQAVRAPAIMQDIISGSAVTERGAGVTTEAGPSGQRYRPGTITDITQEEQVITHIELSEDEVVDGITEIKDERLEEDVEMAEASGESRKVSRRKKKTPADLTFSSGGESEDGEFDLSPSTRQSKTRTTVRKAPARTASTRTRKPRQQ